MLQLSQPVTLSSYVKIAQLPRSSKIPVGAKIVMTGFGNYQRGFSAYQPLSSYLRKSTVYVVDPFQCRKKWSNVTDYEVQVNAGQVCTSTQDYRGACTVSR